MFYRSQKDAFQAELLKQKAPYEYYIKYAESKDGEKEGAAKTVPVFFKLPLEDERVKHKHIPRDISNPEHEGFQKRLLASLYEYDIYIGWKYYLFIKGGAKPDQEMLSEAFSGLDAELVYTDHDHITITNNRRHTPFFKPDWSFDTFMSCDYIRECFAIRRDILENGKVDLTVEPEDPEELIDLVLRFIEKEGGSIKHAAKICCHVETDEEEPGRIYEEYYRNHRDLKGLKQVRQRRGYPEPVDKSYDKGIDRSGSLKKAKKDVPDEEGMDGEKNDIKQKGSVSIIIPSKDHSNILLRCLDSIIEKTDIKKLNYEIIIVDNGSCEKEKHRITKAINKINNAYYEMLDVDMPGFNVRYIYDPREFNFSEMCARGVVDSRYDYLLFLNDDIELKDKGSIERLYEFASLDGMGAVGCKLYYPDSTLIQHAGITYLDCGPSHKLSGSDDRHTEYFGVNRFDRNVLAVTGACLMIKKEKYFNLGGFNVKMRVSYNDVDLCLKALKKGYRNILLNSVIMYHHESLLRGKDDSREKHERLVVERDLLYRNNEWLVRDGDPFYSSELIKDTLDYRVNVVPEFEKRHIRSSVTELDEKKRLKLSKLKSDKNLKYNLESSYFVRGLGAENTDYYHIEGWFLNQKKNNALLEKKLFLISEITGKTLEVTMFCKYREDVEKVFPDSKGAGLSGFVCKIPGVYINTGESYTFLLAAKYKHSGYRKALMEDGGKEIGFN